MTLSPQTNLCSEGKFSRRRFLQGAAGAGVLLASSALPAWARPAAHAAGVRRPDSLPFPHLAAGTASMPRIEHIVVLMLENHSFDNLLGMVPYQVPGRALVDGLSVRHGRLANFNADAAGHKVYAKHARSPCQRNRVPSQAWNASHEAYDNGLMDGFVKASTEVAMWFWDRRDLPFSYSMARHFPIGERFFSSVLAQTYPNRRFFFTGTASGTTSTDALTFNTPAANGTIFDRLTAHQIDWANYYQDLPSPAIVPGYLAAVGTRLRPMAQFFTEVAAGRLPQFAFLDPQYTTTSEENPQDIQVGEEFLARVVRALIRARTWERTALFITYDEHGGYYDHVAPPRAIEPDSIAPIQEAGQPKLAPGSYNRYGFRVPLFVVSPWAKPNYVSQIVQDHTSITAFIERKWNLPAMTFRDANAQPMIDYFDFRKPAFAKPPKLSNVPGLGPGLARCRALGLKPPLPGAPSGSTSAVAHYLARAR